MLNRSLTIAAAAFLSLAAAAAADAKCYGCGANGTSLNGFNPLVAVQMQKASQQ